MLRYPAAVLILAATAAAAETPAPGWGAFAPGSWVVMKTISVLEGQDAPRRTEVITRYTLVAKQGGKAKLEVERTLFGNATVTSLEVPLAAPLPQGDAGTVKRGEETLNLGGQSLKCAWQEAGVAGEGRLSTTRVWFSSAVPGGVAKSLTASAGAAQTQTITEALAWEKK